MEIKRIVCGISHATIGAAMLLTGSAAWSADAVRVTCTRASHQYLVSERAEFDVSAPTNGTRVSVKFSRAYLPPIETVVTAAPARVSFGLGEPGFVICEAVALGADGKPVGASAKAGAGFEPSRIRTALPRPADYDRFWERAFADQVSVPPDFTSRPLGDGLELVSCRTVWGTRMYGFLRLPAKRRGSVALQVSVGGGDSVLCEERARAFGTIRKADETALFVIHLPAWEPSVKTGADAQAANRRWQTENGIPNGSLIYWNCEKGPRERWYYRCILGACRLVDYAVSRPEIDTGRVYYYGSSTGGGYGIFLASFSPHIRAAICEVPNYGNMGGPSVGRPSGEDDRGRYWKTSVYYDAAYCATRITCPTFVSCGYLDNYCVPETVYAIYNSMMCCKVLYDKVANGHGDNPRGYAEVRNAWLDAQLPPAP